MRVTKMLALGMLLGGCLSTEIFANDKFLQQKLYIILRVIQVT